MRNIEARKEKGDKKAKLAFEMCAYRIKKYIGAYMAVLKKVDAIIFTNPYWWRIRNRFANQKGFGKNRIKNGLRKKIFG